MTTYTCPDGHTSSTDDYCDVCGMPIPPGQGQGSPAGGAGAYVPPPVPPVRSPGLPPQPSMPFGGSSLDLDAPVPPPLPNERVCPNCGAPNLPDALYCEDCGYDFTTGQLPRPLDPPAAAPLPQPVPAAAPAGVVPSGVLPSGAPSDPGGLPLPAPPADAGGPATVAAPVTPLDPPGGPAVADPAAPVDPAATGTDPAAADLSGADASGAVQNGGDPNATVDAGPLLAPPVTPTSAPGHVEWVAEVWVDPDWYAAQDVTDPCPSAGMPWVVPILERTVLIGRVSTSRNIHPQIEISTDSGVSRRHAQLSSDGQRWWVEDLQSANGTYVGGAGAPLPTTPILPGQRVELAEDDRIYLGAWSRVVVRRATPEESTLGS